MTPPLYPFYETELHFIRKLAQEFARKYPAAAARLQLEPDRSTDPHVERLIEAFALLSARVQNKLHDEFPELTDGMLSVLYPHVLAPIPSIATVQFTIDPARGTPEGVTIAARSPLHSARAGSLQCRFRTCYPVQLWPVEIAEAKLHPPPYPPGLNPPARAVAALRLRLRATGEISFDKMQLRQLRLHIVGDGAATSALYELILNHAIAVSFAAPGKSAALAQLTSQEALLPVGFDVNEALLPYPPNVFEGYRILTEYFSYQPKFLYVDIAGWDRFTNLGTPLREVEVVIFLNRTNARLEQILDASMFLTGCTPAINLFEQTAEPIALTHTRPEHRLVPDVGFPQGYEVFSVESVTASSTEGGDREFRPFYHFRHGHDRRTAQTFYYTTRRPSLTPDDRGTDVSIHMVDTGFDPADGTNEAAIVRTLCTNRDLPVRLPRVGDHVAFTTAFAAPGTRVKCVRNPTVPLRPHAPAGRYWHLISHLNLNHLSLTSDDTGTEALRGILRLYDPTDPEGEPQASALAKQSIEGIVKIASRRTTAWISGELGGFVRGLEIDLTLDETRFVGGSAYLFASVLERFFALHVSVNSFTQLVARFQQQDGEIRRWAPRAGERPLA